VLIPPHEFEVDGGDTIVTLVAYRVLAGPGSGETEHLPPDEFLERYAELATAAAAAP
jgi:hypothetical protein